MTQISDSLVFTADTTALPSPAIPIDRSREQWGKRAFDLCLAVLGTVVLFPLLVVLAVAIKLTSPGPVFYLATRIGRNGVPFRLYKFRTMVAGADRMGPGITTDGDARVTPVGRFLRRTKLDELPQLLNVIKGEMSLVGPRPEDPRYVAYYTSPQRPVLSVLPGITSLASVRYRNEAALLVGDRWEERYLTHILPDKLHVELRYLEHWSLPLDFKIVLFTLLVLIVPPDMDPDLDRFDG